ncbi:MAG: hypothetical protein IJB34_04370 [Clostridia bacterium]|nr:hypothetical protein [Clostridia bacterium]
MRYVKPPDFKSVKELERHFKDAEAKIATLLTDGSARSANELNARLQSTLSTAVSFLLEQAKAFSVKELLVAFEEGKNRAPAPRKGTARMAKEVLAAQGFKYAKNAFSRDTYIEIRQATVSAGKGLAKRVNATIAKLKKKGEDTVYNVQRAILEDMNEHGVLLVRYANGAKQPLSSYAAMAARSARIESSNIAEIGGALLAGSDLVEMTTMPGCCRLCGAYQGKVYSISGKDKRFPALFKTVLKNGYALPHPNCRHEFVAYFEEMEDPEDVKRKIQKSKIEYDGKGNLRDVREQKDIEAYQAWQAGNRQLRREELEYEEMRAYYEERNEKPPYATLAGFRRTKRKEAKLYKNKRKAWKKQVEQNQKTNNLLTGAEKNSIIIETPQPRIIETVKELPKTLIIDDNQIGKKIGKHAKDFGLNPSLAKDRKKFQDIIYKIFNFYDEIRVGGWRGQKDDVLFYIKENDVVITKLDGTYITTLKDGVSNERVKNARKRKI